MSSNSNKNPCIHCESSVFSELFFKGKFEIPWHQRSYDWEEEHVSELLLDIDEAVRWKRECYFLGSIMLVQKGKDLWEINDGQQRMVTFSLICARLCRLFYEGGEQLYEFHALRVVFNLHGTSTKRWSMADSLDPRLIPPQDYKAYYNTMIRHGGGCGTDTNLTKAWKKIDSFFSSKDLGEAKGLLDFLLNNVEVACLYMDKKKVNPNSVFETINDRGKQLGDFDLIRNNLYSYFNSDEERSRRNTVHDGIESIRTQFPNDPKGKKCTSYSRCYFQCKYGFLPEKVFYRKVRKKVESCSVKSDKNAKKPSDYVFELIGDFAAKEKIALFGLIESPDPSNDIMGGFLKDSGTVKNARSLPIFLHELSNYNVAKPMAFALLSRYIREDGTVKRKKISRSIHKIIKKINSFVMRTAFVVAKLEPSRYEKEFSNFANEIWSVESLESLNVKDFLKKCDDRNEGIMNNKKFIEKIEEIEIKNSPKAKTFLYGLNHYQHPDGELINIRKCTLEHIFPKSSQHWPGWTNFEEQNSHDWVNRVGNLTLLGQNDNKSEGDANENFSNKKQFLARSSVRYLNGEIVKCEDWSPNEIQKRQKVLSKLATQVWDFI